MKSAEAVNRRTPDDLTGARSNRARASLLRYSPAAILIAIAVADSTRLADGDLWGHVRFGQVLWAQGRLARVDPYSYSAFGRIWTNHEWLTEAVMAALYNFGGVAALKFWKLAMTAATMIFLADAMAETGASFTLQLLILLCAGIGLTLQFQFRPQLFTFALFALLVDLMTRYNFRRQGLLWLAIPLTALWANLHGGFIAGLAALGGFTTAIVTEDLIAGAGVRRAILPALVTVASLAATLVNPYAIGMWRAVEHALSDPFTRAVVSDWRPLGVALARQFNSAPLALIYYAGVIALIVGFALSLWRAPFGGDDLPLVVVAIMMTVAALLSVRNMALAVIAIAAPLARHASLATSSMAVDGQPIRQSVWSQMILTAAALAMFGYTGLFRGPLMTAGQYPAGAIAFMQSRHLHGNLLCDFNWGEYLIWQAGPDSRVFVDGRYDTVYPASVIDDYLTFYLDRTRATEVLTRYPHDFVIIPIKCKAYTLMMRQREWTPIYRDPDAVLFARAESQAARTPPVAIDTPMPRTSFP